MTKPKPSKDSKKSPAAFEVDSIDLKTTPTLLAPPIDLFAVVQTDVEEPSCELIPVVTLVYHEGEMIGFIPYKDKILPTSQVPGFLQFWVGDEDDFVPSSIIPEDDEDDTDPDDELDDDDELGEDDELEEDDEDDALDDDDELDEDDESDDESPDAEDTDVDEKPVPSKKKKK